MQTGTTPNSRQKLSVQHREREGGDVPACRTGGFLPAILRVIACFAIFFRFVYSVVLLLRPSGRFGAVYSASWCRRAASGWFPAAMHLSTSRIRRLTRGPRFFPVTASARKPFGQLHARCFGIQLLDALFERAFLGAERVAPCGQFRHKGPTAFLWSSISCRTRASTPLSRSCRHDFRVKFSLLFKGTKKRKKQKLFCGNLP